MNVTQRICSVRVATYSSALAVRRRPGRTDANAVAAQAAARLPADIDPFDMAAIGLAGVTAYEGLRRIGSLFGRRIVVTGAAGGIGSAATAIAHAQGASVVGVIARDAQADYVRSLGACEILCSAKDLSVALQPASVDGILDAVGGKLFAPCIAALRPGGVLCLIGAVGGSQVSFDAYDLLRPVTRTGYSSESLDGEALRHAVTAHAAWLRLGSITPPARKLPPLAEVAEAHALFERGGVQGRILLVP